MTFFQGKTLRNLSLNTAAEKNPRPLNSNYGRNADAPLVVLATRSPSNCFDVSIESVRLAVKFMTPVMLLTDGYLSNSSEPWLIPDIDEIDEFPVKHTTQVEGFHPFLRDEKTLARNWAIPGTPGLEHRIGGIEKDYNSGHISYDSENHQKNLDYFPINHLKQQRTF